MQCLVDSRPGHSIQVSSFDRRGTTQLIIVVVRLRVPLVEFRRADQFSAARYIGGTTHC